MITKENDIEIKERVIRERIRERERNNRKKENNK